MLHESWTALFQKFHLMRAVPVVTSAEDKAVHLEPSFRRVFSGVISGQTGVAWAALEAPPTAPWLDPRILDNKSKRRWEVRLIVFFSFLSSIFVFVYAFSLSLSLCFSCSHPLSLFFFSFVSLHHIFFFRSNSVELFRCHYHRCKR